MMKTLRLLTITVALAGTQSVVVGCATQTADESVAEATQTLSACGIAELSVRATAERIEGDSSKCFVALDTGRRARLTTDSNDLGLAEPRLISDSAGVRVYEGKGTAPGTSLFAAAMSISGYTCSVNGFMSAEEAKKGVEVCSLVKGGAR